jgi:predicted PolB exonuclease-like 3'-5' exonuclease
MKFFTTKKPPRCFEREIEETVQEEKETFGNQFDDIPIIIFISVEILEKATFKEGKENKLNKFQEYFASLETLVP